MTQKRNMVIHFIDGSKVSYFFPKQVEDDSSVATRMKKVLDNPYLIIEGDGTLTLYQTSNIKSIQLYPVPDKLPDYVIRDAEIGSTY